MAIRKRWPISDKAREAVVLTVQEILLKGNERNKLRAAEILAKLELQNQSDEVTASIESDRNQFSEMLRAIEIEGDFRITSEESANTNPEAIERSKPSAE